MEATSYVSFIGRKFDMWIQAWKLIHSLQVMYENWAVSFHGEKQSIYTVVLKNLTTKQRKKSLRLWCGFLVKCFSSGWEVVFKKLLNLLQVALTKIPRNESEVYQETEFHSSEGHLFKFSWLMPGFFVFYIMVLKNFKIYFFNWYFVILSWSVPAYFHSLKLKLMFLTSRLLCIFTSLLLV